MNHFRYEKHIRDVYADEPEKLKLALTAKALLEKYILSYEGAFYLSNVTSNSDFVFYENDTNYAWQGIGYKTILDILIHKFPNETDALPFYEKLKLNEEVVRIQWKENVVVNTKSGGSYGAKRVIFTPSLNVLKQQHKDIFEPELPKFKQEAMQDLGMDAVMKVHAHFPNKWWPDSDNFSGYSFIWDEQSLLDIKVGFE